MSALSRLSASRPTSLALAASLLGVVVLLALGMFVYDKSRADQIARGVKIDEFDVGGLSEGAARRKIQSELVAPLKGPLVVRFGSRSWRIGAGEAHLRVDVNDTVAVAVAVSRQGSFVSRTVRDLFGGSVKRSVPLLVAYSHPVVQGLSARVRSAVDRQPRNATVAPSASGLAEVPDRPGVMVDSGRLRSLIGRALTGRSSSRTVAVPVYRIRPKVSTSQLAARYPTYIVIDRGGFTLRFYEHLKLVNSYPIAVGMQGLETSPGLYSIQWKQVDPPWYVPNSAWAGALAGKTIPPGPEDPLKARFMAFNGGAGIHGIDPSEYGTIGHDASHGCVRMRIPDVIALYSRAPVGTPVYVL